MEFVCLFCCVLLTFALCKGHVKPQEHFFFQEYDQDKRYSFEAFYLQVYKVF
jgi:hypothetical protein